MADYTSTKATLDGGDRFNFDDGDRLTAMTATLDGARLREFLRAGLNLLELLANDLLSHDKRVTSDTKMLG